MKGSSTVALILSLTLVLGTWPAQAQDRPGRGGRSSRPAQPAGRVRVPPAASGPARSYERRDPGSFRRASPPVSVPRGSERRDSGGWRPSQPDRRGAPARTYTPPARAVPPAQRAAPPHSSGGGDRARVPVQRGTAPDRRSPPPAWRQEPPRADAPRVRLPAEPPRIPHPDGRRDDGRRSAPDFRDAPRTRVPVVPPAPSGQPRVLLPGREPGREQVRPGPAGRREIRRPSEADGRPPVFVRPAGDARGRFGVPRRPDRPELQRGPEARRDELGYRRPPGDSRSRTELRVLDRRVYRETVHDHRDYLSGTVLVRTGWHSRGHVHYYHHPHRHGLVMVVTGDHYYWVHHHHGHWWWYHPHHHRWVCWYQDNWWYWDAHAGWYVWYEPQDRFYVVHERYVVREAAPQAPEPEERAYYSDDGGWVVLVSGERKVAHLYRHPEMTHAAYLGEGVETVRLPVMERSGDRITSPEDPGLAVYVSEDGVANLYARDPDLRHLSFLGEGVRDVRLLHVSSAGPRWLLLVDRLDGSAEVLQGDGAPFEP